MCDGIENVYTLDGIEIKDKQKIKITWPDKTETIHKVKIKNTNVEYGDVGNFYMVLTHVPTILLNMHGHRIRINLYELDAYKRIKIEFLESNNEA
jgi:hypothetical protein